jgi:hypothetical protein
MITLNELGLVQLPVETASYTPVPHKEFVNEILEAADKKGFSLVRSNYNASRQGNIMSGRLVFTGDVSGMDMMVGVVNSYDKSKVAMLGIGSQVVICENGLLIADYTMKRKHTTNVWRDLDIMITESIAALYDEYTRATKYRELFSAMSLPKRQQAEMLGRIFVEEEIVTPTMANTIRQEITGSKLFPDDTVWSFYNHVTHGLKQSHPIDYIDRHVEFHKFIEVNFT